MKRKDRERLNLAWRVLAIVLAIIMIISVIFGTNDFF